MSDRKLYRVVMKDNMQYLADHDGKILPMQIWTRVTHKVNEKPYAIVCLFVDLDNTEYQDDFIKPKWWEFWKRK